MDNITLEMIVAQLPNMAFALICVGIQWRIINRLLDKIDTCDCEGDKNPE